jgi:nucleotide-binding universal stress UspA family protein
MSPIRHVLCPYDFSTQCQQITPFVHALALRSHARVTLLGVVPPIWDLSPIGSEVFAGENTSDWARELQSRLKLELTVELSGLTVDRVTDSGDPALKIVEFARQHSVDLIMMPTHGVGLFRSLLLGSVTAKVLHDAACPVWTAAHTEEQRGRPLPATVLCAVDGSAETTKLLQWASAFSRDVGATLKLVHVVSAVTDWPSLEREQLLQDRIRDAGCARIEELQKSAKVSAPLRVAVGDVVETIVEEARQEHADLILIARGSLAAPLARLRTRAYDIIRRSPCPVLSV